MLLQHRRRRRRRYEMPSRWHESGALREDRPMALLSDLDSVQLEALGIPREEVERQLDLFADPPRPIRLERPCRVGDGITVLDPEREPWLLARAEGARRAGRCQAFIPASGAASRMFEAPLA